VVLLTAVVGVGDVGRWRWFISPMDGVGVGDAGRSGWLIWSRAVVMASLAALVTVDSDGRAGVRQSTSTSGTGRSGILSETHSLSPNVISPLWRCASMSSFAFICWRQ
jgi:hypothetical protein